MDSFEKIEHILDYVTNRMNELCKNIHVYSSYPNYPDEIPIQGASVCVGVDKIDILFQNGTAKGEDATNRVYYGVDLDCCFKLDICLPKLTSSCYDCVSAFDKLASACLKMDRLRVTKMTCGKIHYDRILSAIVMECTMNCTAELVKLTSINPSEYT